MISNRTSEQKRRILLMYITRVSGHRQATLAIQQALRQLDPGIEAPAINGFGYTYPLLEKIVNKAYMSVIKRTPKVWDYLYDNPSIVKSSQSIQNFLHKTSHAKIGKLFARHRPGAIVCTQAFPCGMVADYKREHKLDVKLIGVLTDFAPHSYWINEGVDCYIVPSEDVKERLVTKGVASELIRAYGIPLRAKFAARLDPKPIAEKMGLDPGVPTVLVMGGGQGLGPIKKIVESLARIRMYVQVIVLAGTNKKIVQSLRKFAARSDKKILITEFATNVDELMELATIIVTKPGGMTTAESLAKGLPMVIVNPIPGQEMRNTDFLIQKGIGIRVHEVNAVGEEIELLLNAPERLEAMSKAAYANAKPYASLDIARLILGMEETELTAGFPAEDAHV
ncbi:MAG: glycosyltransferase [Candidatus Omnitrophica bacterium]|nr:glycosyltransferase [Candidatus Omnitrophota bacterium]